MTLLINNLPIHERPRERLASNGPEALSDRELVALVLRNGKQGESAIDVATTLLTHFGSLATLAKAHSHEIATIPGIGQAKAAALVAAFHLANRARAPDLPIRISTSKDIVDAVKTVLMPLRRERTVLLTCDAANQLRNISIISDGALDHGLLPVREVLHSVLIHDGRAFAVAHNHPSGNVRPSQSDIDSTRDLAKAAPLVGLRFLDHVIVGEAEDSWTSIDWS